jgi:hypothetical protein
LLSFFFHFFFFFFFIYTFHGAAARTESLASHSIAVWLKRSHFAVGLFLGCVVFLSVAWLTTVKLPVQYSLEFRLRLETPSLTWPTGRSRRLLSWAFVPYSTCWLGRSTSRRRRPPASVRLQGLVTLLAAYALPNRAGSVSHRQRSWDSPFGAFSSRTASGALPPERTHLPFLLPVFPSCETTGRPNRPRLLGIDRPGVPHGHAEC